MSEIFSFSINIRRPFLNCAMLIEKSRNVVSLFFVLNHPNTIVPSILGVSYVPVFFFHFKAMVSGIYKIHGLYHGGVLFLIIKCKTVTLQLFYLTGNACFLKLPGSISFSKIFACYIVLNL